MDFEKKSSMFRDETWGCLKVTEISSNGEGFKAIPISYTELKIGK